MGTRTHFLTAAFLTALSFSASGRDFDAPTAHAPAKEQREWKPAAMIRNRLAPAPVSDGGVGETLPPSDNTTPEGQQPPVVDPRLQTTGNERNNPTVTQGDGGSQNENERGPTEPDPLQPPLQIPPISGQMGNSGPGAQPLAMPQFAQLQPMGQMAMPQFPTGPQVDVNGKPMGILDGGRLTAITNEIGKQMQAFQDSLVNLAQTDTKALIQGMANLARGAGSAQPVMNSPVSGIVNAAAQTQLPPRTSLSSMDSRSGPMVPRTTQPVSDTRQRTTTASGQKQRSQLTR